MPRKAFVWLIVTDVAVIMTFSWLIAFNVVSEGPWLAAVFPVLFISNVLFIRGQNRRAGESGVDERRSLDHDGRKDQSDRISGRPLTIGLALGWVLVVGYTIGAMLWAVRFALGPSLLSGAEFGVGLLLAAVGWYVMLKRSRTTGARS